MANADFTPKEKQAAGGFDAGSYRAPEPAAPAQALTPLQQKLARLEQALPDALKKRTAALALTIVIALASVVGLGGFKLNARYQEAQSWLTTGVEADNGYSLSVELTERSYAAANIITTAVNTPGLGEDSPEVVAARAALDAFNGVLADLTSSGEVAAMYQADQALDAAIDQLYGRMQELAEDPFKMGAVQGQYGNFNSAGTIIGQLAYNEAVTEYNNDTGGFPANVLKGLLGIREVELFA